jgi:thiol-disulfide isomerase/thioredoxin
MHSQNDSVIVTGKYNPILLESDWFKSWNKESENYQPDEQTMVELQKKDSSIYTFMVYLGTWCEDSQKHVPSFIQIARKLQLNFTLVGVNREKECPFDKKECKNWDIEFVPTIIVFKENLEIGRIIESPQKSIEEDLLKIMN